MESVVGFSVRAVWASTRREATAALVAGNGMQFTSKTAEVSISCGGGVCVCVCVCGGGGGGGRTWLLQEVV